MGKMKDRQKESRMIGNPVVYFDFYQLADNHIADLSQAGLIQEDRNQKLYMVEYWFYYLKNQFRWYGKVPQSHAHDLEHVFFVVQEGGNQRDVADTQALVVIANAHDRPTPKNIYRNPRLKEIHLPPHVFVEWGSHASALDADQDGWIVAGKDLNDQRFRGIEWGIRDSGKIFGGYRLEMMQERTQDNSQILLEPNSADSGGCHYLLVPLCCLEASLAVFSREREQMFPSRTDWGTSTLSVIFPWVNSEPLYNPREHPDHKDVDRMLWPDNWSLVDLRLSLSRYGNIWRVGFSQQWQLEHFYRNRKRLGARILSFFAPRLTGEVSTALYTSSLRRVRGRFPIKMEYEVLGERPFDNIWSLYYGADSMRVINEVTLSQRPVSDASNFEVAEILRVPKIDNFGMATGVKFQFKRVSFRFGLRVSPRTNQGSFEWRVDPILLKMF